MMNAFAIARKLMATHLKSDEGLRQAFVANIAMLLHDKYGIESETEYEKSNQAGEDIVKLVFES